MIHFEFKPKHDLNKKYEKLETAINRMNEADNVDTLNHWSLEAIKAVVDIYDIHANILDWNSMGK